MVRYDKKKNEEKTKTHVDEDNEDDTEKTQELDREESMKEEKKEHWELEEGQDVRGRVTNASDELDMREIIMNNARLKVMIKVLIGALVFLGICVLYSIFKTFSYKSEIKDIMNQLNECSSSALAIQSQIDAKKEEDKKNANIMTYHELNSILLKFSQETADENSTFVPKVDSYRSGPQSNAIAFLVQNLFENNKTLPEMSGLTFNFNAVFAGKELCFISNTLTPIKLKEFSYQGTNDYDESCDFKFLTRVTNKASIRFNSINNAGVVSKIVKASYNLEELNISSNSLYINEDVDFSINSTYMIKRISFNFNQQVYDNNVRPYCEAILIGISKCSLKESLQNINISFSGYGRSYRQQVNGISYFEIDMKEIMKKYGLEKIMFNNKR